jgi:hypothetical protein
VPTEVEAVHAVVRGIRRTIGTAKTPKAAATNDRVLAMVAAQKPDSGKSKWVVESQARDGAAGYRGVCRATTGSRNARFSAP